MISFVSFPSKNFNISKLVYWKPLYRLMSSFQVSLQTNWSVICKGQVLYWFVLFLFFFMFFLNFNQRWKQTTKGEREGESLIEFLCGPLACWCSCTHLSIPAWRAVQLHLRFRQRLWRRTDCFRLMQYWATEMDWRPFRFQKLARLFPSRAKLVLRQ